MISGCPTASFFEHTNMTIVETHEPFGLPPTQYFPLSSLFSVSHLGFDFLGRNSKLPQFPQLFFCTPVFFLFKYYADCQPFSGFVCCWNKGRSKQANWDKVIPWFHETNLLNYIHTPIPIMLPYTLRSFLYYPSQLWFLFHLKTPPIWARFVNIFSIYSHPFGSFSIYEPILSRKRLPDLTPTSHEPPTNHDDSLSS